MNMKQIKIDKEKCVACAVCSSLEELITFDDEGYALVKKDGVYDKRLEKKVHEICEECPEKAITIVSYQSKEDISTPEELMLFIKEKLENYSTPQITKQDLQYSLFHMYDHDSSVISNKFPFSKVCTQVYRSESKAMKAGLDEVAYIINGPLKTILRDLFTEYKTGPMYKYRVFEKKEGNYYFDCISQAQQFLEQISLECNNLFGETLPEEMVKICTTPTWNNDSNNKNSPLDYIENYLLNLALKQVDEPSWFDTWIDVDGDEKSWYVSTDDATRTVAKYAWKGLLYATSYCNVIKIVDDTISDFNKRITAEMKGKAEKIIKFLDDKFDFSKRVFADQDWEKKVQKERMERLERTRKIEEFRRIISLEKLVTENVKAYDGETHYAVKLDVSHLDKKKVYAGENYATITEGMHWHCRNGNTDMPQPSGCGTVVKLKNSYQLTSKYDGVIHIFDKSVSLDRCCIGVIAHPEDKNVEEIKKWFKDNCF